MHNHTHTRTHAHAHPPPRTRTNEASLFMFINIFQTHGSIEENHTYSNSRRRRQQNEKKIENEPKTEKQNTRVGPIRSFVFDIVSRGAKNYNYIRII